MAKQAAAKKAVTKSLTAANSPAKAAAAGARMTLPEVMSALEQAGSEQTRKTYRRHGATDPLFGVSFATLATLVKRLKVDHDLASALWETGNFDARNLAMKIADPARVTSAELDRWARDTGVRMCTGYIAMLTAESPHAAAKADTWLSSKSEHERAYGWGVLGQVAMLDESTPDAWFQDRLKTIEKSIHTAPNGERMAMNAALIQIGCRSASLRKAATTVANRIGKVDVDHGDTACKTPDAAHYIDKAWTHSTSKGFASPAAHERSRERARIRC